MEKIKILVVDDESRMRKLVRDFLEREGFEVLEAGDGVEAMDLFYEEKEVALVILDVMMPKMDGWQTLREIRQTSQVPVITTSPFFRGCPLDTVIRPLTKTFPPSINPSILLREEEKARAITLSRRTDATVPRMD